MVIFFSKYGNFGTKSGQNMKTEQPFLYIFKPVLGNVL